MSALTDTLCPYATLCRSDDLPLAQDSLRRYLEGATPMFRSEHRVLDNLGQWVWIRARGRAVSRDAAGNVVRLAGTALNITNDRHVERERRIARSEEHTSELQSLMRISYAVFCLKKNTKEQNDTNENK